MSTQDVPPSSRAPSRAAKPKSGAKPPTCPQCQRRMTLKQVMPVLFASDLDDVIFGCDKCGTEAKRSVKRS